MCGRAYETFTLEDLEARYFNRRPLRLPEFRTSYNIAPTQRVPVITFDGLERQLELMRWQFVPPWESDFKTKLSTINAKSETVFESRLYKKAIFHQRCIVPLSGFFEWASFGPDESGEKRPKKPFAIELKSGEIMSVAGIWGAWHGGDGQERHSFAILTTRANQLMAGVHHRMPVILYPEVEQRWLDPTLQDAEEIGSLLEPCPSKWLRVYEVSTLVNSPRNNRPEVLNAVSEDLGDGVSS